MRTIRYTISFFIFAATLAFCTIASGQSTVTKVELSRSPGGAPYESLGQNDSNYVVKAFDITGDGIADTLDFAAESNDGSKRVQIACSSRYIPGNFSIGYFSPVGSFFGGTHTGLFTMDPFINGVVLGAKSFSLIWADFDYTGGQITLKSFAATFVFHDTADIYGTIYYNFVNPTSPSIVFPSTISPASIEANHPLTADLLAFYGTTPYTWQVSAGSFPPGLSLSTDGHITGAPSQPGNYHFTIRATDTQGHFGNHDYSLQVLTQTTAPPVTSATLVGEPHEFLSDGKTYTLSQATATVDATATDGSAGAITLVYTDGGNKFTIQIVNAGFKAFNNSLSPGFYSFNQIKSNYMTMTSFLTDPPSSNGCDGVRGSYKIIDAKFDYSSPIKINVVSFAVDFDFYCIEDGFYPTPKLSGSLRFNYQRPLKVQISNLPTLPDGSAGSTYRAQLIAHGGQEPYTFSQTGGDLPLIFNPNGELIGAPSSPGTYNFSARVTDAAGDSDERSFTLPVYPPLKIEMPASLPLGIVGQPYSLPVTVSGGALPYSIGTFPLGGLFTHGDQSDLSYFLPLGLRFDGAKISGVPKQAGTFLLPLYVFDALQRSTRKDVVLTIEGPAGQQAFRQFTAWSEGNDFIGGGQNYFFGADSGNFRASAFVNPSTGKIAGVFLNYDSNFGRNGFDGHEFRMEFTTGGLGTAMTTGIYQVPLVSAHPEAAYMNIYGDGRGCGNAVSGSFTVLDAQFDTTVSPPQVISFAVEFDQSCGGDFRGRILYNSQVGPIGMAPVIQGTSYVANYEILVVHGTNLDRPSLLVDGCLVESSIIKSNGQPVGFVAQIPLSPGRHSVAIGNADGLVSESGSINADPPGRRPAPSPSSPPNPRIPSRGGPQRGTSVAPSLSRPRK